MAVYEVTSPDGKVYEVTAPEGATEEQIVSFAKSQWAAKPEQPKGKLEQLKDMVLSSRNSPLAGGLTGLIATQGNKQIGEATDRMAYGAGGAVTDALSGMVPPEVAGGAGYVANVATQAVPSILSGELAKAVATKPMQAAAKSLMSSAAKPTLQQWKTGKAARAIDTLLEEGINPTAGGVDVLKSRIGDLNDEIATAIKDSPAMVNKAKVGARLKELLDDFQNQVNPQSDMETIRKAWVNFRNHPLLAGKTEIPVQTAQKMKQGTYKAIGGKNYGEMKGVETEAQKALARGLKEEISEVVPGVSALNKKESDLLNALSIAERRALMDMNKNPLGLGVLNPATLALWLWDRSGWAKAMTARGLYSGSQVIPSTAARIGTMPILMQSGKPALSQEQD